MSVCEVDCRCGEDGVKGEDGRRVFGCKRVPGYSFCVFVFVVETKKRGKKREK